MSRRKNEPNRVSDEQAGVTAPRPSESATRPDTSGSTAGLKHRNSTREHLRKHWVVSAIIAVALFTTTALALKYIDEYAKREAPYGSEAPQVTIATASDPNEPLPSGTPQRSKEYIYAGSRLLAVEDANATAAPPADLAVWRPSTGVWWVMGGPSSAPAAQGWGITGDIPAQGDFDGDGKTDFSIFRPSTGTWWILKSSDGTYYSRQFGISTDNLAQADFDGDGKTDVAVWRATDGVWYIISSSTGAAQYAQYGQNGDKPAPADYDGDGRADIAVWRSSNNTFYSRNSSNNTLSQFTFTQTSTAPVSADYDGDGRADYAVRSGNNWIVRKSSNLQTETVAWQLAGDKAVQNDYDGDGKVDIATWRDSNGTWYIRQSASGNSLRQVQWGMTGDIPVAAYYRR